MARISKNFRTIRTTRGFSLVEMIVVIVVTGIIAAAVGMFILRPVQGYNAQVRRAELVDDAESVLRRMQRDVRAALPNSIRIRTSTGNVGSASCPASDSICVIEMLHTVDGARYRAGPPEAAPGDALLFDGSDREFVTVGGLRNASAISTAPPFQWLVINNQTTTGAEFNAYNCPAAGATHNCALLNASTNPFATPPRFGLAAAFPPAVPTLASPRQRFFVVDTPVTYLCNTAAGTLTRYQGYAINADHSLRDTDGELTGAGAAAAIAAQLVTGCAFTYLAGTDQRAGLITLQLTLTDPNVNGQSESVNLLHQVHVYNLP